MPVFHIVAAASGFLAAGANETVIFSENVSVLRPRRGIMLQTRHNNPFPPLPVGLAAHGPDSANDMEEVGQAPSVKAAFVTLIKSGRTQGVKLRKP